MTAYTGSRRGGDSGRGSRGTRTGSLPFLFFFFQQSGFLFDLLLDVFPETENIRGDEAHLDAGRATDVAQLLSDRLDKAVQIGAGILVVKLSHLG